MDSHHLKDITSLLDKVRIFETSIGELRSFSVDADGRCALLLSNGTLHFLPEELSAQTSMSLTPEMLYAIAGRFRRHSVGMYSEKHRQRFRNGKRTKNALYLFLGAGGVCAAAGLILYAAVPVPDAEETKRPPQIEDSMLQRNDETLPAGSVNRHMELRNND